MKAGSHSTATPPAFADLHGKARLSALQIPQAGGCPADREDNKN